jgi:hypothetical protein
MLKRPLSDSDAGTGAGGALFSGLSVVTACSPRGKRVRQCSPDAVRAVSAEDMRGRPATLPAASSPHRAEVPFPPMVAQTSGFNFGVVVGAAPAAGGGAVARNSFAAGCGSTPPSWFSPFTASPAFVPSQFPAAHFAGMPASTAVLSDARSPLRVGAAAPGPTWDSHRRLPVQLPAAADADDTSMTDSVVDRRARDVDASVHARCVSADGSALRPGAAVTAYATYGAGFTAYSARECALASDNAYAGLSDVY